MITDLVVTERKKQQTSTLSPAMRTFERLKKQVGKQQRSLTEYQKELEECLAYYYANIETLQKNVVDALKEMTLLFYEYYKGKKFLTKKQYGVFKTMISRKVETLCDSIPPDELPQEIKNMYYDLDIGNYDKKIEHDFAFMKQDMQRAIKEMFGINVDLSSISPEDDPSEIKRKLDESIDRVKEKHDEMKNKEESGAKSKEELLREQQKKNFNELQKREIGAIYRQLAKVFHPDLVQDPEEKFVKEQLMKQLTAAYEKRDLHTLLLLEMHWLNRTSGQSSDDQIKIYNSLLKDQLKMLNNQKVLIDMNPRYFPIFQFTQAPAFSGKRSLIDVSSDMKEELAEYQNVIKEMKGQNGRAVIREIVQEAILSSQQHALEEMLISKFLTACNAQ